MWQKNLASLMPQDNIAAWLLKPNNVYRAMQQLDPHVSLKVFSQQIEHPVLGEIIPEISEQSQDFFIRKIVLCSDQGIPWSMGRTVIPKHTYNNYLEKFKSLGERPIGSTLLHNNDTIKRSTFDYAQILCHHPLWSESIQLLGQNFKNIQLDSISAIWSRRSYFTFSATHWLQITELFLPFIPEYPEGYHDSYN